MGGPAGSREQGPEGLQPPCSDLCSQAHYAGSRLIWADQPRLPRQLPVSFLGGPAPLWGDTPAGRARDGCGQAVHSPPRLQQGPLCQDFTQRSLFSDRSHGGKSDTAPLPGGFMTSAVLATPPLTYSDSSRRARCQLLAPGGSFPKWPVLTGPFKSCVSWLFLNRFVYFDTVLYNKIGH